MLMVRQLIYFQYVATGHCLAFQPARGIGDAKNRITGSHKERKSRQSFDNKIRQLVERLLVQLLSKSMVRRIGCGDRIGVSHRDGIRCPLVWP